MIVNVSYGRTGLDIIFEDNWDVTVITPQYVPGLADPAGAVKLALENPLDSPPLVNLIKPGNKVGIIFTDITRPTPNQLLVQAILDQLSIPTKDITLFNALGTHRKNSDQELIELLGEEIVGKYRIVQNDAFDVSTQTFLGKTSSGNEIWINSELLACDVRILTGFIEPSDIAGFSGGGKDIMPGMAGLQTVLNNHGYNNIGHKQASWGVTKGNPIWEEIDEVAHRVGADFLLNVSLNKDHEVTGVFAGSLDSAYPAGCEFVRATAMVPATGEYDIVITSNSGYPLDQNLYQCVKGMGAAAQVVRQGGAIIVVAECVDGIPDHGLYKQLLQEAGSPEGVFQIVGQPGYSSLDQWEIQIQAQIQMKADVYVHSRFLSDEQIVAALLKPAPNLEKTLRALIEKHGPGARICVLPEGPQTVPYLGQTTNLETK